MTIKYKKGLRCEIADNVVLQIRKFNFKYVACVLDKNTLVMTTSKEYSKLENLNYFLKDYDVEIVR